MNTLSLDLLLFYEHFYVYFIIILFKHFIVSSENSDYFATKNYDSGFP